MGLPELIIDFKTKAETAVKRSGNGIVAMLVCDTAKTDTSYSYKYEDDIVKSDWSAKTLEYFKLVFKGAPKLVLVERIASENDYEDALARLANKKFNWLCAPDASEELSAVLADWIAAKRAAKKTFKAVLANQAANHEGIVNFATENVKSGGVTYSASEYCCRIAGLLAGLPLTRSATYYVLDDVEEIAESLTPDADIDAGKLILINDGEKVKIARAVNSLATLSGEKTEDMKSIKIIEGIDLIRDDIRLTFEENYIGENNSYDNKIMFIAAVNQYFSELAAEGILYADGENYADIDTDANRKYLIEHSADVSEMSEDEIRRTKTGTYVFVMARVSFANAIEDLKFTVYME